MGNIKSDEERIHSFQEVSEYCISKNIKKHFEFDLMVVDPNILNNIIFS